MTHYDPYVSEWINLCRSCGLKDKPFYTLAETSQLVGCARSTVNRWVKRGYLEARPWGPRRVKVTAASIRQQLKLDQPVGAAADVTNRSVDSGLTNRSAQADFTDRSVTPPKISSDPRQGPASQLSGREKNLEKNFGEKNIKKFLKVTRTDYDQRYRHIH